MIPKADIVWISIFVLAGLVLYFAGRSDVLKLQRSGVFVLGKLKLYDTAGVTGMYNYEYQFHGKTYKRSFTGPIKSYIVNDSVMFFKILPSDPNIARQISDVRVPRCITLHDVPEEGWKSLPDEKDCK
jgi:hypothetical protein